MCAFIIRHPNWFWHFSENQTVPNQNRGFFPKTKPKLTDLSKCETVTTLIITTTTPSLMKKKQKKTDAK